MRTQDHISTRSEAVNPHKGGAPERDAWDEDLKDNQEEFSYAKTNLAPQLDLRIPERNIECRDDLSFTGRVFSGKFTVMDNWLPPRLPTQIGQWHREKAMGYDMAGEIMRLREEDEHAAHEAMKFAFESDGWRTGGEGIECGFAEAIAALAIVGMRAIAGGAEMYRPV
ncbi:hypothetical protein [Marinobacter sp. OP 3.4]|uniref:hypothetical protein n=1 Tax=Marinobacter sp. OP 3.4 TaxID=3076501 RepID=UPI002E1B9722